MVLNAASLERKMYEEITREICGRVAITLDEFQDSLACVLEDL